MVLERFRMASLALSTELSWTKQVPLDWLFSSFISLALIGLCWLRKFMMSYSVALKLMFMR